MPTANTNITVKDTNEVSGIPSHTVPPQTQHILMATTATDQNTALKERNKIHSIRIKMSTINRPSTAISASISIINSIMGGLPTGKNSNSASYRL